MPKPTVAIIGTGGTISIAARDSLDLFEYPWTGRVQDVPELITRVPELAGVADTMPVPFRAITSMGMDAATWLELVRTVHRVAQATPTPDGIVITHGTATLEETAYFLDLTVKVPMPVVVVGAQRPSTGLSTDASMNLLAAVRVAGSPAARGLGVLVVMNDEIQAAREVTKTSNFRLQTFRSQDIGPLGFVDPDGSIAIYRRPAKRHAPHTPFDVSGLSDLPRVDVAYAYVGADGTAVRAFVAAGAKAIVSAGFPPGVLTRAEEAALVEAQQAGVLVIQSSRAGTGRVLRSSALDRLRFIAADNLNPQKARICAALVLTRTHDVDEARRLFEAC
jgi:L-asparaginase